MNNTATAEKNEYWRVLQEEFRTRYAPTNPGPGGSDASVVRHPSSWTPDQMREPAAAPVPAAPVPAAATAGAFKPSFKMRLLGFDPKEVLAFCDQVMRDHERVARKLEEAEHELQVARVRAAEPKAPTETTSHKLERILLSAERIADDIESSAKGDSARLIAEAGARAANVVQDAEQRAAGIVDEARSKVTNFAEQVARMQTQYAELRAAIERAADAAASARSDIAGREQAMYQ